MASTEEMTATIEAHVAAVGAADAEAVASLYGAEAELQDPAGTTVAVGRGAIREHFARVLTEARKIDLVCVVVTNHHGAVHFRATTAAGATRDVIDTMTFDEQAAITSMQAYAG